MVSPHQIHASAPIRICDNGGWTDTWAARYGKVFNIAVRPLVSVRIDVAPRGTRHVPLIINAEGCATEYASALDGVRWGRHPLLEAALCAIPPPADIDVEVTIRSNAPAGASTGTSAAVTVALLGALDQLAGGDRTPADIAAEAHAVETVRLRQLSGVQDQLCSAHGGVNFIDIGEYPHALVSRLQLHDDFRRALQRRLLLIYLGRPHSSSAIHEKVMRDIERSGPDSAPLRALRTAAEHARDAILARDLTALGRAMSDNTAAQAALHPDLVHQDVWRIIDIAKAHGALGWKVNGAGGDGGSITVLTGERRDAKRAIVQEIRADDPRCVPIPIVISREGLRIS